MSGIGISTDRIDGQVKVTGSADYAADRQVPGLLIALGLRSPVAHGRIVSIDVSAAQARSGVVKVYTHLDAERLDWRSDPAIDALGAEHLGRPSMGDEASRLPAYRPLTGSEILFAGQWIAVVVAETFESAREALEHIRVEVSPCAAETALPVRPGPFFAGEMQYRRGPETPPDSASHRVSATYHTPIQLHQPMEPSATTAIWDETGVTLHDTTQGTKATRNNVAESLRLPVDKVRVMSPYVGGGFGSKNQIWPHQALAAHLARDLGRPVRVQLTRADMAVASGYRSETRQDVELLADDEGRLLSITHDTEVPTSLRGGFFEPCGLNTLLLYRSERIAVSHTVVRRSVATPTPFRAPGETPGTFALETALDELAHQLKIDPIELRLRNFPDRDEFHGRDWSGNNLRECYALGAERIGWPSGYVAPRSVETGGVFTGYGMATTAYPAQAQPASVRISLSRNGPLSIATSATDIGTGMRTLLMQTACEMLGLAPDAVEVRLGDSAFPDAPSAGRSRSTASVLPAASAACRALLQRLDELAPIDPSDASNRPRILERFERTGLSDLSVSGSADGVPREKDLSYYSFGAHFVELTVDTRIARLRIRRMISAIDCGRIVNPNTAASQVKGGLVFGIGMALTEDARRHPTALRVMGDNLADYAIPVHADMPEMEVVFVDRPDPAINEFGLRGLGEIGLPGVAAAIGNAVFSATGRRVRSLPISFSALIDP